MYQQIKEYKLGCAFNGGKESVVVFDLIQKHLSDQEIVYFNVISENDFPELEEFLDFISKKYNILIHNFSTIKEGIIELKRQYEITGILMGCRKTDPYCSELDIFTPTDENYPDIMRINPIINWSYKDVWDYIDENKLDICSLYKKGYTSIGDRTNTFPNYTLFKNNKYLHAKNLNDETKERVGRIKCKLPYKYSGKIVKGKQMGRKLGFPTANLSIIEEINLDEGVYWGKCYLKGDEYMMVMSYGKNITLEETILNLEVHILHKFNSEFYGEILEINILGFIRPMIKFESLDGLKRAINNDINTNVYLMHSSRRMHQIK